MRKSDLLLRLADLVVPEPTEECRAEGRLKEELKSQLRSLYYSASGKPRSTRLEWFQEIIDSKRPRYSVGEVKFDLIIGNDCSEKPYTIGLGYSIVHPAHHTEARGHYQSFGTYRAQFMEESLIVPLQVLLVSHITLQHIENAMERSLTLNQQPYGQMSYNDAFAQISEMLKRAELDGVPLMSDPFSDPIHPEASYVLLARQEGNTMALHKIGTPREQIGFETYSDIVTFKGQKIEILDQVIDRMNKSYVHPVDLETAIKRAQAVYPNII